jgi:hypothetical protein
MRRKSWIPINPVLMSLVLVLCAPLAPAQSQQELLQQAQAAERDGKLEAAEVAFCALAKSDASYMSKCKTYSDLANKERQNDAKRLADGRAAFRAKDYEEARKQFRNVKTEQAKAEAADYLNTKIPAAEKELAAAQQQEQQQQAQQQVTSKIQRARDALGRQDFDGARNALAGVDTPEARSLLSQITQAEKTTQAQGQYDQKVRDGDAAFSQGRYSDAANSYRAAAGLRGSTPDDLKRKIDDAENRMRSAQNGSVSGQILDTSRQPVARANITLESSNGARQSMQSDAGGNFRFSSVAPGSYLVAASKDGRPLDSKRVSVAPSESAVAALVAMAAPAPGQAPDSATLERAIALFYRGSPEDLQQAEWMLRDFAVKGKKKGLSDFYVGASKLARYYLAGASKDQETLYNEAVDAFRQAKRVAGFRPPLEISPKILRVYQQAR